MKKIVISLGGSVIIPNEIDYNYLKKFKRMINGVSKKNKIVIVCGGGKTARKYIGPLMKEKAGSTAYALIGIAATRINARLVRGFFGITKRVPESVKDVKNDLKKSNLVICGALGMRKGMTSDGNAVEIASEIKADFFVNITDVLGLYNKDPKLKGAKLIEEIDYKDFLKMVNKIKFKAGQHFILDQASAKLIKKNKVKTLIVSKNLKNLKKVLRGKKFKGTVIG